MEIIELSFLVKEVVCKTTKKDEFPVLTSSRRGLVCQNDYFNKQIASKDNIGYKIIKRNQYTYRSMSDTGCFYINRLKHIESGIVSPAYPVFEIISEKIIPEYLDLFFKSENFQYQISNLSQGSTRLALRFSKLLKVKVPVPEISYQIEISKEINKLDELKYKYQKQIDLLEEYSNQKMHEYFGN